MSEFKKCSVPPCNRNVEAGGLCAGHRSRKRKGGDMTTALRYMAEKRPGEWGDWMMDGSGYIRRQRWMPESRKIETELQHRYVMERVLGRPLVKGENVHHRNGQRSDNRPENLELWVTRQPSGQRPEDLVKWAREVLERYDDQNQF